MQRTTSGSASWMTKLITVLKPVPPPLVLSFPQSPTSRKHHPGQIWKHIFTTSVFHDLTGALGGTATFTARDALWWRFVRLECIGLSGVIIYAISPSTSRPQTNALEDSSERDALTVRRVFGDLENSSDGGMSVDELLDAVEGRVVFFPTYSCTSFVTGQAVRAAFTKQARLSPHPAKNGFSILHEGSFCDLAPSEEPNDELLVESELPFGEHSDENPDDVEDLCEEALLSLCVRSSKPAPELISHLDLGDSSDDDLESKEDSSDSSLLTIDTTGPDTPSTNWLDDSGIGMESASLKVEVATLQVAQDLDRSLSLIICIEKDPEVPA